MTTPENPPPYGYTGQPMPGVPVSAQYAQHEPIANTAPTSITAANPSWRGVHGSIDLSDVWLITDVF